MEKNVQEEIRRAAGGHREDGITLRLVTPEDAGALLEIYGPYVRETAISFEYEVPTLEEFRQRICHTLEFFPYLAAEKDGELLGYAYASRFHVRAAYDWAVELSIYVCRKQKRSGVGGLLYRAMEELLKGQGILILYACIAFPEEEDEYLDRNSVEFHSHMGYHSTGVFHRCGYKFGRWYGMVWMEKRIGEQDRTPMPIKSFPEVYGTVKEKYLLR